jgi:hypothetical protein
VVVRRQPILAWKCDMPLSGSDVTFLVFQRLYPEDMDHNADPFQMSIAEISPQTNTIGYLLRNV